MPKRPGMSQDSCKALAAGHGYERKCLSHEMEVYSWSACLWSVGRLVHIDFGFILETSPGGNMCFESVHFKLSHEMTQLLNPSGAMKNRTWYHFVGLCVKGYLVARRYVDGIVNTDNLARFSRKDKAMLDGGQMQKFGQKVSSHREFSQLPHSFGNAIKGKAEVSIGDIGRIKKGGNREKPGYPGLQFMYREEDRVWLQDCWYGEVALIEDLLGLECKLKAKGVKDCNIRYLGGRGVLLLASGSRDIKAIVVEHKKELQQWFVLIKPWETMDIVNNTKGHKCLEFARILLHTSSMGMINSLVIIQVDSAIVSVRVAEEGTLFDGHEILRGYNEGYPSVLVSRSYIEESLIGESLMGYRLSKVKVVDDCQTDYQTGVRGSLADRSGTLQRRYGEPDDGAGKGFSRRIFEFGDGCINGCNNYSNEGENCSPVIIPNSGSVKKGIGGTIGLTSAAHLMESGGLKMNSKEAQMLQAESGKRENNRSFINQGQGVIRPKNKSNGLKSNA
ncbi:hypothetical protein Ancab_017485 [Ancistrocladus abbreviatus]